MILLLENNIRGGISSVMGDRYIQSDEDKKIFYIDATNLYSHSMSQLLPYDETKFEKDICLEEILNTPDDRKIGYFLEVDLKYWENLKEETKILRSLLWIKKVILMIFLIMWKQLNLIFILKLKNWYVIGLMKKIIWFNIGC